MQPAPWWQIDNAAEIPSPALVIHRSRVEDNIRRMIAVAGGTDRLRPHIKTAKIPQVAQLQLDRGIQKFKCATIAEAEMLATLGAPDVLVAYQPVGPQIQRLLRLIQLFPSTVFSTLVDSPDALQRIESLAAHTSMKVRLWLDLDCGMRRTGIEPSAEAVDLYRRNL